jgi:transcriptional regulator with XRE-family HTH domain
MMAESASEVLVRRRSSLLVTIAAASTGLTAGYLWRFASSGRPLDLIVGLLLAVIALGHLHAWTDSRRPIFVADDIGVRLRLGSAWTGVAWDRVETVEIEKRGRLKDGRVVVLAPGSADLLARASRRARWAASLNRRFYGASLVAPYGLATSVSVPDLATSLERLADGRTPVVVLGRAAQAEADPDASAVVAVRSEATGEQTAADETPVVAKSELPSQRSPVPRAVRREERTISLRPVSASYGSLALSEPSDVVVQQLPQIDELRRSADVTPITADDLVNDADDVVKDDAVAGNVSLIIDATTDLSARAMQRVRDFQPAATDDRGSSPASAPVDPSSGETVIGGELAHARETLGLTVDELADRTRIRPSVIESIERDDFSPCGGDFYAKGHLRMLTRVLGIDARPVLDAYDQNFAASPVQARDVFEAELATGSSGTLRGTASGANWGALIAAVVVLMAVWGAARFFSDSGDSAATSGVGPSHTHTARSPRLVKPPPVAPAVQAHVQVTISGGDTHVVVRDRSMQPVFSGVLVDGTVRHFHGAAPIRVHAADAGLVSLSVHGKTLGPLGSAGSPAYRTIGVSGPR